MLPTKFESVRDPGRSEREDPGPAIEVAAVVAEELDPVEKERIRLGLCPGCGIQLFEISGGGFFSERKYVPLTDAGIVYKGGCLNCHPELRKSVGKMLRDTSRTNQSEVRGVVDGASGSKGCGLTCSSLNETRARVGVAVGSLFVIFLLVVIFTLSIMLSNERRVDDKMTNSASDTLLPPSPTLDPSVSLAPSTLPPLPQSLPPAASSALSTLSPTTGHSGITTFSSLPALIQTTSHSTLSPSRPTSVMELCDFEKTYATSSTLSRGLWFRAPADFCIVGLRVPNEADQSTQNVEVFLMDSPPPAHPATASVGSVFRAAGEPTAGDRIVVPDPKIDVASGEYVGLLGTAGETTAHNSYCADDTGGTFETLIGGHEVTLNKFATNDANIALSPTLSYYDNNPHNVGRVEMFYELGQCGS